MMALAAELEAQELYPITRDEAVRFAIAVQIGERLDGIAAVLENEGALRRALGRL